MTYSWSKRGSVAMVAVFALGLVLAALVVVGNPLTGMASAGAQSDACSTGGDYPPDPIDAAEDLQLESVDLLPGQPGTMVLTGAEPGAEYCCFVFSSPVECPATTAADDGTLNVESLAVPSDFELIALHSTDVYRLGDLVYSATFCVGADGKLADIGCSEVLSDPGGSIGGDGGGLPFTGGWTALMIQIAAALLALGVYFRYLRRRRLQSLAA